jgi:hypothetical protein
MDGFEHGTFKSELRWTISHGKIKKCSIQTSGIELANMIFASTPVPYHADWFTREHEQPAEVYLSPLFYFRRTRKCH